MLDIKQLRDYTEQVAARLATRGVERALVDEVLAFDEKRRQLTTDTDQLKARRNEISKQIPQVAKDKGDIEPLKAESRRIGDQLKSLEDARRDVEEAQRAAILRLPNIPHESTPAGTSEDDNVILRSAGSIPHFASPPKTHWELGEALGIIDLGRGASLSGSGFYVLKGPGARLERALVQWMLDTHTTRNGYVEVQTPFIVSRETMTGTGQLPKFEDDLYRVESEDLFLIPTAEVPVTNLHAGEILDTGQLPLRYCAFTPCFRREAGSYGKENRGISRVHQFNKVELVHFVEPEKSAEAHEELTRHACSLLDDLGLAYRVLELCTADIGFSAAKCYDLEIWAPGMDRWLEVSSCSNFLDFQARRANIRYRPAADARPEFVHTLNGSGLALPRLVIALLENGQRPDGGVDLPPVLHDYFGATEIKPA